MAKKPARTWTMVLSLGIPLSIVGAVAMAISYATLIDVARVNGLPLPELFPILVDVGSVTTMIAAAQFRLRGISGRWLAYSTFAVLSVVSIVANASHAGRAADLSVTTPWAAMVLAATPPAILLAITHLVMMSIPDDKERAKLQLQREKDRERAIDTAERKPQTAPPRPMQVPEAATRQQPVSVSADVSSPLAPAAVAEPQDRTPVEWSLHEQEKPVDVKAMVLAYHEEHGKNPTGAIVGEWLGGKSAKTGQRFLKELAAENEQRLEDHTETRVAAAA